MARTLSEQEVLALQQRLQQLETTVAQANTAVSNLRQENALLQAKVRPPQAPPFFEGTGRDVQDLDMWFLRVRNYLAAAGITDDRLAIRQAVTLFGAVPLRWWQALAPNPGDMPFASWEEFTRNVRLAFPGTQVAAEARQRLYSLTQRPSQSFGGYLGTFQAIASRIPDLSEAEKMHCLLRGVLPPIRAEILRVNPQTFTAQVAVAAQAAAILGMSKVGKPWSANPHPRDADPVPMDLGQLTPKLKTQQHPHGQQAKQPQQQSVGNQGPPTFGLSPAQIVKHKAENRCFRCHKRGHTWHTCAPRSN